MLIKELNAIRKDWTFEKIKIGLVYPNTYRVAMTSLGVQLLYFLFNSWENFICERIFKPLNPNIPPYSLENQKKLSDFDILAISCQFEHDYIQTMNLLYKANFEPDVRKRKEEDPLVIIGGPSVTANPAPVLFLPDVFFLGDLEPISDKLRSALERKSKKERIESLVSIPGIMGYNYHYNEEGNWIGEKVESVKIKDLSNSFYPIKQIIPEDVKGTKNEPIFGKAFYLETDRGCSERCMFCFVGHCRFPRAGRNYENLTKIIDKASEVNVFDKVVIYGSAIAQSGKLSKLVEYIVSKGYEVSCSSFRADYITEELLKALKNGKQRTLALAPETGDEHLRLALNKRMSNESIFSSLKLAWDLGFRKLKLYMIYGFPCETEETKEVSVNFIKSIREKFFTTGKISISMNQLITKAHTPFQFTKMLDIRESKETQKWFKKSLYQIKNIDLSLYEPEWAVIQRILSLRDHNYFPALLQIGKMRNTIGNWKKILKNENKQLSNEATWNYSINDTLPWDNITHILGKENLIQSYRKYREQMEC
ncbi:MAG: radical SAM protein [Candidatus Heimdallarchaeota archaeon]